MSEGDTPAASGEGEGFLLDELDESVADAAMESVLADERGRVTTEPGEAVEAAIMDDVVAHFETEYDPDVLGIDRPDEDAIRAGWFDFDYLGEYGVVSWRWSTRPYSYTAIVYDPEATSSGTAPRRRSCRSSSSTSGRT